MRVIECDRCGETLSAANDAELARSLSDHLGEAHGEQPPAEEVQELLAEEAYDAMDS